MLYLKDANEGENAPEKLFENIARIAKDLSMNVVLYRHHDTFCYLGQDKLIDARARKLMLRMLSALYHPEDNIKYEYAGNPLRKVLEYMFRSARDYGLLANECFEEEKVAIQLASLFMAGYNVRYEEDGIKKQIRWGNPHTDSKSKIGDAIFTPEIATMVNNIREFTNEDSHTSEDEPWYIKEERKDLFFSHVLQMCHVIRWFGKCVAENNNIEENRKKHRIIEVDTSEQQANRKVRKEEDKKAVIHTSSLSADDLKGRKYLIMKDETTLFCGSCKLDVTIPYRSGQVIIEEVVPNDSDDKKKYPFVATKVSQVK